MSTAVLPEADAAASSLAPEAGAASFRPEEARATTAAAALNGFASEIMQFVRPLEELLEKVTGDPAGLYQASHAWETYAGDVQSTSALYQQALTQISGHVQGITATVVEGSLRVLSTATHSIADWSKVMSQALQLCVRAVEIMRSLVCAGFELLSTVGGSIKDFLFGSWPWELDKKAQVIRDFADNCAQVVAEATSNIDRALQALREAASSCTDRGH